VIQKAQMPGWHQIFLGAIGANWFVCMAVFSISTREIGSKILAPSHPEGEEAFGIASPGRRGKMHGDHLPHPSRPLQSVVGQELSEKDTKRKGSDETEKTAV
jgi:hypothetical protein